MEGNGVLLSCKNFNQKLTYLMDKAQLCCSTQCLLDPGGGGRGVVGALGPQSHPSYSLAPSAKPQIFSNLRPPVVH